MPGEYPQRPFSPHAVNDRRSGFTLVELLVSIGLLVVLMSLIMAVTNRARDQSMRANCTNNLRRLVNACHCYAAENNTFLPFPSDDSANTEWKAAGWLYNEAPGSGVSPLRAKPTKLEQVTLGSLWKYMQDRDAYHCPADPPPYLGAVGGRNSHELTSYQMSWVVGEWGHRTQVDFTKVPAFRLGRMPSRGIIFWEGDEVGADANMWSDGTNMPENGLTRRHGAGATVACFDGSTAWITRVEFDKMANASGKNMLWCNPVTTNGH
jgi:prepilin-type N-terminal cleavage/methylation domain-containing protein